MNDKHPLLHVATPAKRARRAMVAKLGRRQARKEMQAHRTLVRAGIEDSLYVPPAPRCHRKAFHRVNAAFRAMAQVIQTTEPGALRIAAFAELPVYRSRGKGKGVRRG